MRTLKLPLAAKSPDLLEVDEYWFVFPPASGPGCQGDFWNYNFRWQPKRKSPTVDHLSRLKRDNPQAFRNYTFKVKTLFVQSSGSIGQRCKDVGNDLGQRKNSIRNIMDKYWPEEVEKVRHIKPVPVRRSLPE